MTTSPIVKAEKIETSKFKISKVIKVNKYSGKSVYVSYNDGIMRVQLPKMDLPFGVSKYVNPENGDTKYSLDLSMKDIDQKVFDNFKEIEDIILEYAEKNSVELFKKKRSKEILREVYKPFIKFHEENGEPSDKYPARFKAKLWTTNNEFTVDVYDSEKIDGKYPKIKMTLDNSDEVITPGSKCEAIVQCSGIWVVGDSFGISWSVVQIKAYKNNNAIVGYAFQDEEQEETTLDYDEEQTEEQSFEDNLGITIKEVVNEEKPVKKVRRKREEL
jgi:hypothetical protein